MTVRKGKKEDAPFLVEVVTEAIGQELCVGLAGGEERLPLVRELFGSLAAMPDSQYSYENAFVAEDAAGLPAGGIIAYDGASLRSLRRAFIREANRILGWNVTEKEAEAWGDEADQGEIYIDSLYVRPAHRRKGVASALIDAVEKKFEKTDKPLGLLVEPENKNALAAYARRGFHRKGVSNFFRTPMLHMQKDLH